MAAGTNPIYVATLNPGWLNTDGDGGAAGPLKTQNTALDGTGTVLTLWTAGANGAIIDGVLWTPAGTNILTVARHFMNNGSTNATLGNNSPVGEFTLNATTASATTAMVPYFWRPASGVLRVKANYKLLVTIGTTVAAGYFVHVVGGDL